MCELCNALYLATYFKSNLNFDFIGAQLFPPLVLTAVESSQLCLYVLIYLTRIHFWHHQDTVDMFTFVNYF